MIRFRISYALAGLLLLMLTLPIAPRFPVAAQRQTQWSPRQRIPGIGDEAESPYLVADQNRTVHAFHSMLVGQDRPELAIVYSQWSPDHGWTTPVDILLPFEGDLAHIKGAFLDQAGMFHIIFYCCDDFRPNIYYSRAPAVKADWATAWSAPKLIGENARAPHTAALAADDGGHLFVLYGGDLVGKGIYAVQSADTGETWSDPIPVFLTDDEILLPFSVKMTQDQQGKLHALWTINRPDGNGDAIYYARLESPDSTWSEAIPLAQTDDPDARLERGLVSRTTHPSIVSYDSELIVIYTVCAPCELRVRRSIDDGYTWTEPRYEIPSRGEYGPPDFVIDNNDVLHLFRVDRIKGSTFWHFIQRDHRWLEPEPVVPLSENVYPLGHPLEHAPIDVQAIISQGNIILTSWRSDRGHVDNGTWYSYKFLDAPELPVVPLPTLPSQPRSAQTSMSTPAVSNPAPETVPELNNLNRPLFEVTGSEVMSGHAEPIFIALVPVVLLVSIIVGYQIYRHYQH